MRSHRSFPAFRTAALAAVVVAAGWWWAGEAEPQIETAEVVRGDFSDVLEVRGEVRPVRSTYVKAPPGAGELIIITLVRNGTRVKAGDVVAEFDAVTLKRTVLDKQSELRTAQGELDQAVAQNAIKLKEAEAAVVRAGYDVERARLALGDIELVSVVEAARNKLALADAEERLREAEVALASARSASEADRVARERRIEKVKADLDAAIKAARALKVVAPADGTVHILPNHRAASTLGASGNAPEYRAGDRTYAGAGILELPDLSSVFLEARIDEADRGQLRSGQPASIRVDAVADRDYEALVSDISLLARVDFLGGWPPPKQFDLKLAFIDADDRLQTGMSAVARIEVGTLTDVLLVPANAVQRAGGTDVVHVVGRRGTIAVPVEVIRRGREQAAIVGEVQPGDRVALAAPAAPDSESGR
jgi:multidrug efflux pump subunit AcrA (membrane-fusion protein)